jgi:hypothetical protein
MRLTGSNAIGDIAVTLLPRWHSDICQFEELPESVATKAARCHMEGCCGPGAGGR